jgi:hypothetical protein
MYLIKVARRIAYLIAVWVVPKNAQGDKREFQEIES